MLAAAIIYLPGLTSGDKDVLICTSRGSSRKNGDVIAVFEVHADGSIKRAGTPWVHGVGGSPRGMAVDSTGRWVCVAGQKSGGVAIYERVGNAEFKEIARLEDVDDVVAPTWIEGV